MKSRASTSLKDLIAKGFLQDASEALQDLATTLARETQLAKGDVLFEQDDAGDSLYVIASGALEFSVMSEDGRKLSLDVMRAGAIFGEIALFDPGPRTATVTAIEPSVVWGIKNADVLKALRNQPELGVDMIQLAGKRMRWMGKQLRDQVFLPLPTRLAQKILYLAKDQTQPAPTIKLSQAELAEFVGASRETVAKILAVWKRDGTIDLGRGVLRIMDRGSLKNIASAETN